MQCTSTASSETIFLTFLSTNLLRLGSPQQYSPTTIAACNFPNLLVKRSTRTSTAPRLHLATPPYTSPLFARRQPPLLPNRSITERRCRISIASHDNFHNLRDGDTNRRCASNLRRIACSRNTKPFSTVIATYRCSSI